MPNGIVKIGSNGLTPIKTGGQYILYKEGISVRSLQYKGILGILCLLLTCQYDISGKTVFLFLLAVFCFCLTDLGSEKPATVIFIYAFGILSLSMPAACFFLPLVSYDLWRYHLCRWHCLFFFFPLYSPFLHPSPLWFCPFVLCVLSFSVLYSLYSLCVLQSMYRIPKIETSKKYTAYSKAQKSAQHLFLNVAHFCFYPLAFTQSVPHTFPGI